MSKVVRHPSAKKTASLLLRELLEKDPKKLSVIYRNQMDELEIACCDEWDNEDLALAIALQQVWFGELILGTDDE